MSMEGARSGLEHAIRFDDNVRQYEAADDDNLEFYYRHRTTSLHRNLFSRPEAASVRSLGRNLEGRRHWVDAAVTMGRNPHERQVDEIVNKIEEDIDLVDDTQEAEQFRREALRDMPQSLTMKRSVKYKLLKNLDDRPHEGTIGCGKRTVYKFSMFCSKFKSGLYDFLYTFELWYKSLKKIEGQFGSAAATFFRFFRWLFLLNVFTCLVCFAFVTLPQILDTQYSNHLYTSTEDFYVSNLFTGEGYLKDTVLFYGFYTNETVVLWFDFAYSMPHAYFFTLGSIYIINFIILSISMARSYRRNFIETKGGLKNVFAHKIFCGWDFGIATQDAAELKASNIYNDLKELLVEYNSPSRTMSILMRFWTWTIQGIMHILVLILLGSMGYGMWTLLDENRLIPDTYIGVVTAIVVNVIMFVVPFLFIFISKFEDYKNPRTVFYITLTRTFLLELLVIGILVIYWILHAEKVVCWQTSLGQEIYRLIIFDFFFSVAFLVFTEIARSFIFKYWKAIGRPEFDIARYTLQLTYNQTLFWMGLYFSPLLSIVVVLKYFITWYMVTATVLSVCKPASRSWRTAQTQTWFLIMAFACLLLVMSTMGYVIASTPTSQCGPFKHLEHVFDLVKQGILNQEKGQVFWQLLIYLVKPGVVALILLTMCVAVYYLRAKAQAQQSMVNVLQNMLVTEAKDKEFLLQRISQITKGQWQYNLQETSLDPFKTTPKIFALINRRRTEMGGDLSLGTNSSDLLLPSSSNISLLPDEDIDSQTVLDRYKKFD